MKKITQILPVGIASFLSIVMAIRMEIKVPVEDAGIGLLMLLILVFVWFGIWFVMALASITSLLAVGKEGFSFPTTLWVPSVIVSIVAFLIIISLTS